MQNYIYLGVIGFVIGIVFRSFFDFGSSAIYFFLLLGAIFGLFSFRYRFLAIVFFFLFMVLGVVRFEYSQVDQPSFIKFQSLFVIRDVFIEKTRTVLPEPEASLAVGLLTGDKTGLGQDLDLAFRRAGVSHIVVLSGYNITIVADSLIAFFLFIFSRGISLSLGALGVILFTIMTGAEASTVRSAFMAMLILLAKATGRVYQATLALMVAGILMLIWNPRLLIFNLSFELSFLATAGIFYISPLFPKKVPTLLSTTLGAEIAVLPLVLYKFGQLSLVGPLANVLILIFIPTAMLFTFLAGASGFVSLLLSKIFAGVAYLFLTYIIRMVEFLASFPLAAVSVAFFPAWMMILTYLGIILLCLYLKSKNSGVHTSLAF